MSRPHFLAYYDKYPILSCMKVRKARSGGGEGRAALSPRQRQALDAVRAFAAERGLPPTRAELGRRLGVSPQTADFHLRALERKGRVRLGRRSRSIAFEFAAGSSDPPEAGIRRVPLVGRVAAGAPLMAVENLEGTLPLPEGSGADFALRVQGDSMVEAGILNGDLVLVEKSDQAALGDIVVAMVGEGETVEATVKHWLPGRGRVVLRPANSAHTDIVVRSGEPLSLAGRVVGVLRMLN